MSLKTRLKQLERQQSQVSRQPFRLVVSHAGKPLDLTKATCTLTIWPNGQLFELVDLNGGDYGPEKEDLEKFVQSFAVEKSKMK